MVFFAIFTLTFLSADYLITGSVTNTWIGIAIITGTLSALVRWFVTWMLSLVSPRWDQSSQA